MLKYHNKKTIVDGIKFDSKREAIRYNQLKLLERAKEIKELELQPSFILQLGFEYEPTGKHYRPITYVADFRYYDKRLQKWCVEDVKGMRTEVYKIKKKLFLYAHQDELFLEV